MTTDFAISEFSELDSIAKLTSLLHSAYAKLGAMGFNYTAVDQNNEVTRRRIVGGVCLVAYCDSDLIGTIVYKPPGVMTGCHHFATPGIGTVGQFGVRPDFQGRGLGNSLLLKAETLARKNGDTELALDTAEGARHLVDWYNRSGYRFIEHAQREGKTYRSVILSKRL